MQLSYKNTKCFKNFIKGLRYAVILSSVCVFAVVAWVKYTSYPLIDFQYLLIFQYVLICLKNFLTVLGLLFLLNSLFFFNLHSIFSWRSFFFMIQIAIVAFFTWVILPSISFYNCLCLFGQSLFLAIEYEPSLAGSAQEFLNVFMDSKGSVSSGEEAKKRLGGKIALLEHDQVQKTVVGCLDLERLKICIKDLYNPSPSEAAGPLGKMYGNGKKLAGDVVVDKVFEKVQSSLGIPDAICKSIPFEKSEK
jgi:hypothetical protein